MNDSQNKKYWRRWSVVQKVNHWRWLKGRLVAEAVREASAHHAAVWRFAETLADQSSRAVTANDLRHACHVHACGRDISHEAMSNDQFNRLLLLWGNEREIKGLLVDTLDIRALSYWENPEIQKKDSLVRAIRAAADEKYIESITVDLWGTIFWEDLDNNALLGLLRKLKGNAPAQRGEPY